MAAQINSLGFARAPAQTRVVVAMSGSVDSSVTAAMLHAGGYEVIGVTLQLYDHGAAAKKFDLAVHAKTSQRVDTPEAFNETC